MNEPYHRSITKKACADRMSPAALKSVVAGNLWQDFITGQVGHPEYHFTDIPMEACLAYVEREHQQALSALKRGYPRLARHAFGRLSHAAQDFYAHSNYIQLWLEAHPEGGQPDPLETQVLQHPRLHLARTYPIEFLCWLPGWDLLMKRFLAPDSHTWMNLDTPRSLGCRQPRSFELAVRAAELRTGTELDHLLALIGMELGQPGLSLFLDQGESHGTQTKN